MVAVAQLVESRIVIPVVAGSSPVSHPNGFKAFRTVHSKIWKIKLELSYWVTFLFLPHIHPRMHCANGNPTTKDYQLKVGFY